MDQNLLELIENVLFQSRILFPNLLYSIFFGTKAAKRKLPILKERWFDIAMHYQMARGRPAAHHGGGGVRGRLHCCLGHQVWSACHCDDWQRQAVFFSSVVYPVSEAQHPAHRDDRVPPAEQWDGWADTSPAQRHVTGAASRPQVARTPPLVVIRPQSRAQRGQRPLLSWVGFRHASDTTWPAPSGPRDTGGEGDRGATSRAASPHEAAVLRGSSLWPPAASGGRVHVREEGRSDPSLEPSLPGSLHSHGEKPEVFEPRGRRPHRGRQRGQAQAPPRQGSPLPCSSSTTRPASRPESSSGLQLTLRPLLGGAPVEERTCEAEVKKSASLIVMPI